MKTQVALTVDVEFSIGGHFADPTLTPVSRPMVEGRIEGREHGLGFILNTLASYGIEATFFVETIHTRYFGPEVMRPYVDRIGGAGHDIELHVHPEWAVFEDGVARRDHPIFPLNGSLNGRSEAQVRAVLDIGLETFEHWGLNKPVALRTGSLYADVGLYPHLAAVDIPISSSVGLGVRNDYPEALKLNGGRHFLDGVLEVPVTTYTDLAVLGRTHLRPLQITACSADEMESVLSSAHEAGVETVVILTHPSEYMKARDFRYEALTRNRVNQERLERLCRFLAAQPERFDAVSFRHAAPDWLRSKGAPAPELKLPTPLPVLQRLISNRLNDSLWRY